MSPNSKRVTTPKGRISDPRPSPKPGAPPQKFWLKLLPKEINSIYWPKNMYWRKPGERFVRPVRWLVAMLDDAGIPWSLTESEREARRGDTAFIGRRLGRHRSCRLLMSSALEKAKVIGREQSD